MIRRDRSATIRGSWPAGHRLWLNPSVPDEVLDECTDCEFPNMLVPDFEDMVFVAERISSEALQNVVQHDVYIPMRDWGHRHAQT